MTGWQYPNNVRHVFGYKAINRLTNIVVSAGAFTVGRFDHQTAATGHRTALDEVIQTPSQSVNHSYEWEYDGVHRLTEEAVSGGLDGTLERGSW